MHSRTYQKFQMWKSTSACTDAESLPVTPFISLQVYVSLLLWEKKEALTTTVVFWCSYSGIVK